MANELAAPVGHLDFVVEEDFCFLFFVALISCSPGGDTSDAESQSHAEKTAPRVYVTNEASGDLSIIDTISHQVLATVPLGKRP